MGIMDSTQSTEEYKVQRLVTVLRTLRNVNRLLAKERDRGQLITDICNTLVKDRGYFNAWIILFDPSGNIAETAQTGVGRKFAPMIEDWKRSGVSECAHHALSSQEVILTEDPQSLCPDCPLSRDYEGRGALTTKLDYENRALGILCVSTPKHWVADEEEKKLIQEVGRDIAFTLASIDSENVKNEAERLLQESEDRYRSVFENSGAAVVIIEEDTTLSMVNSQFEKLCGWSKAEIEGKMRWPEFVAPADKLRMLEYHRQRRNEPGAAPSEYEFRFIDRAGKEKIIFSKVGMIPGTKKSVASFIDITSLQLAEQAHQESEERFRDLIENSPFGISFIQKGKVVYRNPEQQRLFGPPSEFSPPFNMDNIHPDDLEKVRDLYQALVDGKTSTFQTEFRFFPMGRIGSKPDVKWVACRAIQMKYKGEDAVLVNMLDITRSKELEHFLLMQDKMASLGHMAAGIAHEIRNPLSGINIYINTLEKRCRKRSGAEREMEILEQIKSASFKIESVIRRVMDFSRPGEPKLVISHINTPIEEAVKLASVTLRKSQIQISTSLAENLPECQIDPHLIEEVLLNLITNAADAMQDMESCKAIEITTSLADDKIEIKVSDTGPGVPFHLRSKIFDPFYTTKSDSSGIGLSISHRIISDHGGSIEVGSSNGGGAEFKVEIPLKMDGKSNG
jgi:PAS domain S-box-containing protein